MCGPRVSLPRPPPRRDGHAKPASSCWLLPARGRSSRRAVAVMAPGGGPSHRPDGSTWEACGRSDREPEDLDRTPFGSVAGLREVHVVLLADPVTAPLPADRGEGPDHDSAGK